MASRPRPPWFRFYRPPPAPAPAPASAPAPTPVQRPSFPVRPPPQQIVPSAAPQPPPPAPPAAPPPPAPPRSPVTAPVPQPSPPRSPVGVPAPQPSSPRAPATAPPSPPVGAPTPRPSPLRAPAAAPPSPPVAAPAPLPSPPRAPAAAPPNPPVGAPAREPSPPSLPAAAPPPMSPVAPPAPVAAQPRSPVPQLAQPSPPTVPPPDIKSHINYPITKSQVPSPITKSHVPSPPTRTSPVQKPIATSEAITGKAATPVPSPRIGKPFERNQSESPKHKPLSRPPSPFELPPAQIKSDNEHEPMVEQKNMVVQQVLRANHNNSIASNGKREPTSKDKGKSTIKKLSDSEEMDVRVITLAGENKGAVMQLSPSRKKNNTISSPWNLQKNGNQSSSESGEEGKSRNKEKANGGTTMQPPMTSYFNSNVQGLNNSIVYNTTFQHKDPGIHLSLRKTNGKHSKD